MDQAIKSQILKYLSGGMSLAEFRQWFAPIWVESTASQGVMQVLGELSDYDEGFCTLEELNVAMLKAIQPLEIETGASNTFTYAPAICK